jgi:hypothetical protein
MNTTYYLSSLDSKQFQILRVCQFLKTLHFDNGKPVHLLKINPVIIGQTYGLGSKDIDEIFVTKRLDTDNEYPQPLKPIFIYICRSVITLDISVTKICKSDVEILGIGELYENNEEAEKVSKYEM